MAVPSRCGMRRINTMAETAAAKPAFRDAFRRCLVPVDGFYEWQKRPAGRKQPYAIVSADGKPFAMSGLVGELEGAAKRRDGADLHDYHRAAERACRANP